MTELVTTGELNRRGFIFIILVWTAIGLITVLGVSVVSLLRYVREDCSVSQFVPLLLFAFGIGVLLITATLENSEADGFIYAGGVLTIGASTALAVHALIQTARTIGQ